MYRKSSANCVLSKNSKKAGKAKLLEASNSPSIMFFSA